LLPVQAGSGRQLAGQLVYAEGGGILSQQRVPAVQGGGDLHTKRGREEWGVCVGVSAKQIFFGKEDNSELIMHFYSVADLDPGSGAFLTPGSGMGKKIRIRIRDEQPGANFREQISESLETNFWVKILKFFDGNPGSEIWNPFDPGFKIWNGKNYPG
jgi:hypothetical protein